VLLKPLAIATVCTLTIPCSCNSKVYCPSRDYWPISTYSLFVCEAILNPIQNIYQYWLLFHDSHVHGLAQHGSWEGLSKVCIHCGDAPSAYNYDECYSPTVYLNVCVLADHICLPLHCIKVCSVIIMIFVIC
jgi:hypothetical protein